MSNLQATDSLQGCVYIFMREVYENAGFSLLNFTFMLSEIPIHWIC